MSRVKESEIEQKPKAAQKPHVQSKDDLISALKNQFATTVTRVYVNSLDREVAFREITVQEQKTLTRIMGTNENRKDVIFDAQCALINQACLEPGFDIYSCSDFDRLKLLMSIYQTNMFANEVKFTCEECGAENAYKIDFDNVLRKLDEIVLEQSAFDYENKSFKYHFTLEFPTVKDVSDFHKSYCQKHRGIPRKMQSSDGKIRSMDYLTLFIKQVEMENKSTGEKICFEFKDYTAGDREDILSAFPQDVLYTTKGVMVFITEKFMKPLNDSFDKHECALCGAVHEKGDVSNSESFF